MLAGKGFSKQGANARRSPRFQRNSFSTPSTFAVRTAKGDPRGRHLLSSGRFFRMLEKFCAGGGTLTITISSIPAPTTSEVFETAKVLVKSPGG
jgi:hypothetical protein